MSLRGILNVTHAWLASQYGWDAVKKWLEDVESPPEVVRARTEAERNRAGMQALTEVAALPRAGGSR